MPPARPGLSPIRVNVRRCSLNPDEACAQGAHPARQGAAGLRAGVKVRAGAAGRRPEQGVDADPGAGGTVRVPCRGRLGEVLRRPEGRWGHPRQKAEGVSPAGITAVGEPARDRAAHGDEPGGPAGTPRPPARAPKPLKPSKPSKRSLRNHADGFGLKKGPSGQEPPSGSSRPGGLSSSCEPGAAEQHRSHGPANLRSVLQRRTAPQSGHHGSAL